jgi:hypothetical protein
VHAWVHGNLIFAVRQASEESMTRLSICTFVKHKEHVHSPSCPAKGNQFWYEGKPILVIPLHKGAGATFSPVGLNCYKVYLGDRDNVEQLIEDLDVNCFDRWAL